MLAIVLLVTIAAAVHADDARRAVRKNPFVTDQYDVYRDGRRAGIIRPDPFVPDRYDLRDDRGRPQGTIRQNPFVRDQWDVETRE